jgi:hypothetical protein
MTMKPHPSPAPAPSPDQAPPARPRRVSPAHILRRTPSPGPIPLRDRCATPCASAAVFFRGFRRSPPRRRAQIAPFRPASTARKPRSERDLNTTPDRLHPLHVQSHLIRVFGPESLVCSFFPGIRRCADFAGKSL